MNICGIIANKRNLNKIYRNKACINLNTIGHFFEQLKVFGFASGWKILIRIVMMNHIYLFATFLSYKFRLEA